MAVKVKDNVVPNLKINGNKVVGRSYSGKSFSRTEIRDIVEKFKRKYKSRGLQLMVSVNTPDFGFRSAKQFSISSN